MLITASSTCIPSAGGLSSQRENHITPVSTLLSALGQGNRGTCLNASHMLQVLFLHIYVLFWYCSPKPQHKSIFRTWDRKWVEIRTSLQVKRNHLFDTQRQMKRWLPCLTKATFKASFLHRQPGQLQRTPWPEGLSVLNIHSKDWCWSSNTLATWCEELTHWKRPWCWERLKAGGEGMTEDEMVGWHHRLNGHGFE